MNYLKVRPCPSFQAPARWVPFTGSHTHSICHFLTPITSATQGPSGSPAWPTHTQSSPTSLRRSFWNTAVTESHLRSPNREALPSSAGHRVALEPGILCLPLAVMNLESRTGKHTEARGCSSPSAEPQNRSWSSAGSANTARDEDTDRENSAVGPRA